LFFQTELPLPDIQIRVGNGYHILSHFGLYMLEPNIEIWQNFQHKKKIVKKLWQLENQEKHLILAILKFLFILIAKVSF
jgi:hypothetical protein